VIHQKHETEPLAGAMLSNGCLLNYYYVYNTITKLSATTGAGVSSSTASNVGSALPIGGRVGAVIQSNGSPR